MFHAVCISPHCGVARLFSSGWTLIKNPTARISKLLSLLQHYSKVKNVKGVEVDARAQSGSREQR